MRFTFWAVGVPFLLGALQALLSTPHNGAPFGAAIALVTAVWFFAGCGATFVYWMVRLVRHAWSDGRRQATPVEPSDKIFGRIS